MAIILDIETVGIDGAADLAEPVTAPANWKDPVKIAAYVAEKQAEQTSRAALYPWTARIVAVGIIDGDQVEHVLTAADEAEEAALLRQVWQLALDHKEGLVASIIGYNHLAYDLPVLLARSALLGVKAPPVSLDKYRTPCVDLMLRLTWNGAIQARSLKWFARRFGLPVDDTISGSDIAGLYAAGDWTGIKSHVLSDIRLTRALAERLGHWRGGRS
jgi:predicted PolB exonuclease-like 3'-5' exonuclease